ncbi:hypothetical protein [Paenibacillus sp. MBLB4367]|uniref:hypothetical protein n=1 Tax=Paenibacillus sp. MBLB4367 TaxID=3384767 RepID=UPI003907FA43
MNDSEKWDRLLRQALASAAEPEENLNIKGRKPWQVNIVTMNGGYSEVVLDGIMYRLIDSTEWKYSPTDYRTYRRC